MKCNFKEDIKYGIFNNKSMTICLMKKSIHDGLRRCDNEENCILVNAGKQDDKEAISFVDSYEGVVTNQEANDE